MSRRSLSIVSMLALFAGAASPALANHEPRVAVEEYYAGPGEVVCLAGGLGCVLFFVQGGESTVRLAAEDDTFTGVGMDVCSPDCSGVSASMCAQGTVAGLKPGDRVVVFLPFSNSLCGIPGGASHGTVTATFT